MPLRSETEKRQTNDWAIAAIALTIAIRESMQNATVEQVVSRKEQLRREAAAQLSIAVDAQGFAL